MKTYYIYLFGLLDVNPQDNSHSPHSRFSPASSTPTVNKDPSNTPAPFSKDAVHISAITFQSLASDTANPTIPPSCTSPPNVSRTRCNRSVTFPSRLADYI
nr:hypothetical protein HmN_000775200 [Hymenolepis microstoma]